MKVLIMAGGTGGHVFPALAIAQALKERGDEVLWLGTRGRLEEQLVPRYGFDIEYIDVKGIRGNGLMIKLKAPFMILHSLLQALRIINKFKPDAALGMGGYASGPGGLACFLKGIKLCLHEQNAAAGLTNRLLSKVASKILLGFEGAFSGPKVEVVGNPVRKSIAAMHGADHNFLKDECLHIMVLGGSLGAKYFNDNLPGFFKEFARQCPVPLKVFHQCGKGNREEVLKHYEGAPFSYEVSDFVDDMQEAYSRSDLLICRAGALTCAELCCAGVPCLFVPLPIAVDDHQTKNAQTLVKAGGALICRQKDLNAEKFASMLLNICSRGALTAMSKALYSEAKLDAADRTVAVLDLLAGRSAQKEESAQKAEGARNDEISSQEQQAGSDSQGVQKEHSQYESEVAAAGENAPAEPKEQDHPAAAASDAKVQEKTAINDNEGKSDPQEPAVQEKPKRARTKSSSKTEGENKAEAGSQEQGTARRPRRRHRSGQSSQEGRAQKQESQDPKAGKGTVKAAKSWVKKAAASKTPQRKEPKSPVVVVKSQGWQNRGPGKERRANPYRRRRTSPKGGQDHANSPLSGGEQS